MVGDCATGGRHLLTTLDNRHLAPKAGGMGDGKRWGWNSQRWMEGSIFASALGTRARRLFSMSTRSARGMGPGGS